jgi:hypothetical protein
VIWQKKNEKGFSPMAQGSQRNPSPYARKEEK